MTTKAAILETIGDGGLLLPELINEGLAANDRVKYYLTLLQAASSHAQQPLNAVPDLRSTRESSGVTDASLDELVAASRHVADGVVFIPGADRIRQQLFDDVRRMLDPLRATASQDADNRSRFDVYCGRLAEQVAAARSWASDEVEARVIDAYARAADESHDTLHRLVMDLHRELIRLLTSVVVESVDGARASGLTPADRALVSAFMKGVNETAPLKFDHPGLATTAVRYGDRLSIQNDLGTTEGHIVVVRVSGLAATVIYSDLHRRRTRFLQDLLDPSAIAWQARAAGTSGQPEMTVGRFTAADVSQLQGFLKLFGSRLVFLIDWNRARKQLARFVSKADAAAVLKWAADTNVGHRGFLQAGGAQLIYTAFERVAPPRIAYGARLDELIGQEAVTAFLKAVLDIASTGLAGGRSGRLIQDEVEAELLSHLKTTDRQLLDAAAEHAMLMSALAERLRRTLTLATGSRAQDEIGRTAKLARGWEARADELVRHSSRMLGRPDGGEPLTRLLAQADDVADALEETAFLLTLVPETATHDHAAALRALADLVGDGTKEYVRCLDYAKDASWSHGPSDVDDVLVCIDRIAELEHASDAAERAAKAKLVSICTDFRELQILFDAARGFEQAADALARCALTIRDHVLSSGSNPA